MKRKFFGTLLSLLMIAGMVFQGINTAVHAEGTPHVVDTIITDFRIEKPKGTKPTELNKHEAFYLAMDWKVKDTHAILHKGDYFDIKLPDNLRFPPSYSQPDFDLLDANGEVIARAHVTHGTPNEAGGTIRVTFNEKIDNKYNVKGTLYLGALFNKKKIKDNQKNKFEVSVNGKIISTEIKVTKTGLPPDQILTKWGERVVEHGQPVDKVSWFARINYRKSDLKNAVITDELSGNETYIKNSFELKEVEYNDDGEIVKELGKINLDGKLSFSNGDKSFRINLGSPGKKQYILVYTTTYTAGTQLKNKLKITYDGDSQEVSANFKDSTAGGTAGGDLASKIKLIKVDEEDNNIVLEDAIFEVTAPDGHKFELKTGADGTVISEKLTQGAYKVKEKKAPKGYELGTEEYTLNVTPSGGAIKKITNKRIKINICGKKTWDDNNNQDGKRPTQITVNLLKNGTKFKSVTVKAD
uniref:Ig-like domain-containing protein n=1 Tax=Eggerthia catenaformis TaxID=31973 RepID=UPI000A668C45